MDTALPQKFPYILDRNLAKANCTENHVCTSCDKVVLDSKLYSILPAANLLAHNNIKVKFDRSNKFDLNVIMGE